MIKTLAWCWLGLLFLLLMCAIVVMIYREVRTWDRWDWVTQGGGYAFVLATFAAIVIALGDL